MQLVLCTAVAEADCRKKYQIFDEICRRQNCCCRYERQRWSQDSLWNFEQVAIWLRVIYPSLKASSMGVWRTLYRRRRPNVQCRVLNKHTYFLLLFSLLFCTIFLTILVLFPLLFFYYFPYQFLRLILFIYLHLWVNIFIRVPFPQYCFSLCLHTENSACFQTSQLPLNVWMWKELNFPFAQGGKGSPT